MVGISLDQCLFSVWLAPGDSSIAQEETLPDHREGRQESLKGVRRRMRTPFGPFRCWGSNMGTSIGRKVLWNGSRVNGVYEGGFA